MKGLLLRIRSRWQRRIPQEQTFSNFADSGRVRVIGLTGGPCGGKTSALVALSNKIPQMSNYRVVHVPELSTLFHTAGSHYPAQGTHDDKLNWDYEKLKSQLALEDAFRHIAEKSGTSTIILCDRGALDTKLFVSEDDWINLISSLGYDESELLSRYDAVVHLVTTAIGAEDHYSGTLGNAARRETLDEAKIQDRSVRKCWMKHPNFVLISNNPPGSTFEHKLKRTVDAVCSQVGIRTTSESKRQWIVVLKHEEFNPPMEEGTIRFQIETDFISSSDTEDACIQRTALVEEDHNVWPEWDEQWAVGTTYSLHDRSVEIGGAVRRKDVRLNKREWTRFRAATTVGGQDTISMKRTCFVDNESFWKLDEIVLNVPEKDSNKRGVCLMTLEGADKDDPRQVLPPFCKKSREVSLLSLRDLRDIDLLEVTSPKT